MFLCIQITKYSLQCMSWWIHKIKTAKVSVVSLFYYHLAKPQKVGNNNLKLIKTCVTNSVISLCFYDFDYRQLMIFNLEIDKILWNRFFGVFWYYIWMWMVIYGRDCKGFQLSGSKDNLFGDQFNREQGKKRLVRNLDSTYTRGPVSRAHEEHAFGRFSFSHHWSPWVGPLD